MPGRFLVTGSAFALVASMSFATQAAGPATKRAKAPGTITVSGCVERASDVLGDSGSGQFVLARSHGGPARSVGTPAGKVYRLNGSESDLSSALGNRVVITAQVSDARSAGMSTDRPVGTSGASPSTAADSTPKAGKAANAPELQVQSVRNTDGACPAGWQ
jgi:hypothetical protein